MPPTGSFVGKILENVDLVDVRLAWLKNREITSAGAVLVRPDGYLGFHSLGGADDPLATLASVFSQILSTLINNVRSNHACR
jgi:2,4-dichlorophenol 6-monooxygenase